MEEPSGRNASLSDLIATVLDLPGQRVLIVSGADEMAT